MAAAGLGAYLLLPAASVVLTLRPEPLGPVTFTALVDPGVNVAQRQASNVVPAWPGVRRSRPAARSRPPGENVLETAAIGKVTFSSGNTVLAVPILAGTQVTTAKGVAFTTTRQRDGAQGDAERPEPGAGHGRRRASWRWSRAPAGNVAAAAIVKVPPDLAAALVLANPVTNKEATTGGTRSVSLFVQQADIDAAEAAL